MAPDRFVSFIGYDVFSCLSHARLYGGLKRKPCQVLVNKEPDNILLYQHMLYY